VGNSDVFLTLSLNSDVTPGEIYSDFKNETKSTEEVHIVRWDTYKKEWIDQGGVLDTRNNEVTTVVNPLSSYGVFTLAKVKAKSAIEDLEIYTALSPNGDGANDFFRIDGIEKHPNNRVEVYNRWGVKVYETTSYNNTDNFFAGISDGRATVTKSETLPTGTYFYTINLFDSNGDDRGYKAGYLYISDK
jgi:gliding motility-associated-like protein